MSSSCTMISQSVDSPHYSSLSSCGSCSSVNVEESLPGSCADSRPTTNNGSVRESTSFADSALSTKQYENFTFSSVVIETQNETSLSMNDRTEELSSVDKDGFVYVSLNATECMAAKFPACEGMADITVADTQEFSLSCDGQETNNQNSPTVRAEVNSPADFVLISTLVDEWNIVNLKMKSEVCIYSIKDDAERSASDTSTKLTSTDSSVIAKPCLAENDFNLELFKFALRKNNCDHKLTSTNECNKRTNSRRRRKIVDRTKLNRRKWKANSLCEEVIDNFDFSLFPYRAEHMTTDVEELAYMDAQLAKLEASAKLNSDEITPAMAPMSSTKVLTCPNSLVEIVTDNIDKTRTLQSHTQTQCSMSSNNPNQTENNEKSKNNVNELEISRKLKLKNEPSLYFADLRCDSRTSYEDRLCPRHTSRSMTIEGLFDLQDRGAVLHLRNKRKWRIEKAHVQVKTKYCQSVCNAAHGRTYYAHHRITKLMPMCVEKLPYSSRRQLSTRSIDKAKGRTADGIREDVKMCRSLTYTAPVEKAHVVRPPRDAPAPRYAINRNNADASLSADLINILITMQDRDLSPEDYELLLRLDERVAPKTIDASRLNELRTEIVGEERVDVENCLNEDVCTVCMDMYQLGQVRKYLPCGHGFHAACIDGWLTNASVNCPLDGQEVRL